MSPAALARDASFLERARRFFVDPPGAELALEFTSTALIGARVESKRGAIELRAVASEPLSEGALAPSLENPGFAQKEELRDAVKRVLSRIGSTPLARTALVVPDVLVRFRLFAPEEIGAEPKHRDDVVAFRMRKLLPFPPGDVRVVTAFSRSSAQPVLGAGFSSTVLSAYEQVGRAFSLDVGSVETSSMALLRGLQSEGDALLVRHDHTWLTLTLTRDGWPVSIRSFDATVARSLEDVRAEIASTAVFWRDRLDGKSLAAAFVHASDPWFEALGQDIESAFGRPAERARPPSHLTVSGIPAAVERSATPALALLGGDSR